jgi:cytochrome c
MRLGYLIPALLAGALAVSGCGGEAPAPVEPAGPAVPVPTLADLPAPYTEANLDAGKGIFGRQCASCHYTVASKGHLVGPNLHGVFERGTGKAANYKYSPALENFEHKAWTAGLLDQWLVSPQGFVAGTSMFYNGIKDETQRRDLIAYLLIETRK